MKDKKISHLGETSQNNERGDYTKLPALNQQFDRLDIDNGFALRKSKQVMFDFESTNGLLSDAVTTTG